MPGPITDVAAWVVVASFAASGVLSVRSERIARGVAAGGWLVFAGFWAVLVPHFAFAQRSFVEGALTAVAVPACLYAAYLVWAKRPSLLVLSRAVAFMGLVYLPFQTVPGLERATVTAVTIHTARITEWLGYAPEVTGRTLENGATLAYPSRIVFTTDGHRYATPVLLACSGIGSISIVSGLVLAVDGGRRRKALALGTVVPLIYALNLVRTTFIVLAHGKQWFDGGVADPVIALFGVADPRLASYYFADRVLAQVASVVALICITVWLLRVLPGLAAVVEEGIYVLTGREVDLRTRFREPPAA